MCGIAGYVGQENALPKILNILKRLEYRGYDSAGVALGYDDKTPLGVFKKQGGLKNLKKELSDNKIFNSKFGIGHTRWATHGAPSDINAHPHSYENVHLVHNGIIENAPLIKESLLKQNRNFVSNTDSEIIAHLFFDLCQKHNDPLEALSALTKTLHGAFAIAIILESEPMKVYFAKKSMPLLVAKGKNENFISSCQTALADQDAEYFSLKDYQFGFISKDEINIFDINKSKVKPQFRPLYIEKESTEKSGFKYFMEKELFEMPSVVENVFLGRLSHGRLNLDGFNIDFNRLKNIKKIHIIACGSAYIAGLAGKNIAEKILKIPTEVEIASEFRYRDPIIDEQTLVIAISQSGETADTLAAAKKAQEEGGLLLSICNTVGSSLSILCEEGLGTIYLQAGPEIAVASTKAFIGQVLILKLLILAMAKFSKKLSFDSEQEFSQIFLALSGLVSKTLKQNEQVRLLASKLLNHQRILFIARGDLFPIALEGALKMKELAYISAEGYPAGELKHGPIALIEQGTPVVTIFSNDGLAIKTKSNLQEVKARGAYAISIASNNMTDLQKESDFFIGLEDCHPIIAPILSAVIVQLLAYHVASQKGLNIDQPRNLAKSVTVE